MLLVKLTLDEMDYTVLVPSNEGNIYSDFNKSKGSYAT